MLILSINAKVLLIVSTVVVLYNICINVIYKFVNGEMYIASVQ